MKVRVNTKSFINGDTFQAGDVIDYSGPLGINFDPLDNEAKAAQEDFFEKNPHARTGLKPTDELPMTVSASLITAATPEAPVPVLKGDSLTQAAQPGPSEGAPVPAETPPAKK